MALSQSTLDASQIELILSSKGLQGELLKTTTDEIANVASTKAMANAQRETTTSTIAFEKAIKGTGASLKQLALAHPYLLAITAIITGILNDTPFWEGHSTNGVILNNIPLNIKLI